MSASPGDEVLLRKRDGELKMQTKTFHVSDILSVTTGRLVSIHHMDGVYDVLNFMTGQSLMTHALPRAKKEIAPVILEQHPALATVDASFCTPENHREWLSATIRVLSEQHGIGEEVELTATPDRYEVMHPLDEPILDRFGSQPVDLARAGEDEATPG